MLLSEAKVARVVGGHTNDGTSAWRGESVLMTLVFFLREREKSNNQMRVNKLDRDIKINREE